MFEWINGIPGNNVWKSEKPLPLTEMSQEQRENWQLLLRNGHRIKTTQPISMVLVSFFSEYNVLSDEIKKKGDIFEYQSNENRAFRFFGTPGIEDLKYKYSWCNLFDKIIV